MKIQFSNIAKPIFNFLLEIVGQSLILVCFSFIVYILWEYVAPVFNLPKASIAHFFALLALIRVVAIWVFIGLKSDIGSKNTASNANTNINK